MGIGKSGAVYDAAVCAEFFVYSLGYVITALFTHTGTDKVDRCMAQSNKNASNTLYDVISMQ